MYMYSITISIISLSIIDLCESRCSIRRCLKCKEDEGLTLKPRRPSVSALVRRVVEGTEVWAGEDIRI